MASVAAPSCWEAAVQFLKCPTSTHTGTHTLGLGTVCTPRRRAACRCQCQHIKSCQISVISRQSNMPQTHTQTHWERVRYWCPAVEEMRKKESERVERQRSRKTTDTQRAVERADWLWLTVDSLARDLSSRLGSAWLCRVWLALGRSALALVFGTLDGSQPVYRLIRVAVVVVLAVVVVVIKIKKTFWQLREKQSVKTYGTGLLLLPIQNGNNSTSLIGQTTLDLRGTGWATLEQLQNDKIVSVFKLLKGQGKQLPGLVGSPAISLSNFETINWFFSWEISPYFLLLYRVPSLLLFPSIIRLIYLFAHSLLWSFSGYFLCMFSLVSEHSLCAFLALIIFYIFSHSLEELRVLSLLILCSDSLGLRRLLSPLLGTSYVSVRMQIYVARPTATVKAIR